MLLRIVLKIVIVGLAVFFAQDFVPGIAVVDLKTAILVAVVLAILNLTVRPILFILTLPITLLTFGLFSLVLNTAIFWSVTYLVPGFTLEGLLPAFLGAIVVAVVGWLGEKILKN